MINIRRDVDDVFYRYKMHPIQSKVCPHPFPRTPWFLNALSF